jgi:hypothetical protein
MELHLFMLAINTVYNNNRLRTIYQDILDATMRSVTRTGRLASMAVCDSYDINVASWLRYKFNTYPPIFHHMHAIYGPIYLHMYVCNASTCSNWISSSRSTKLQRDIAKNQSTAYTCHDPYLLYWVAMRCRSCGINNCAYRITHILCHAFVRWSVSTNLFVLLR